MRASSTTTPQIRDLIGWMKKNNHAAGSMFWRSLANDDVKFLYLWFWRHHECAAVNLSVSAFTWKPFVASKRKCTPPIICTTWPTWHNRKRLNLTQSSILMWRFRFSCRRGFLNSLIYCLFKSGEDLDIWPRSVIKNSCLYSTVIK